MARMKEVSDDVLIAVDPSTAYEHVSDVTQMPRWSPENTGAVIDESPGAEHADDAYVGMTFVGSNARGGVRWRTRCEVTAADRGRRFAFRVSEYGFRRPFLKVPIASWAYTFEPVAGGCRVTETWTDDRGWPDVVAAIFDRIATRKPGFAEFQRDNIRRTLDGLKAELER
ncbi:SRPBCC family protein [Gordonia sp. (in: high G+C Gram-positive bacteria)]|uniref:SRPBCC family protein n=1 Tax=Gordonia sp. (in: high G+C Gram-positive bacteria) TaxID=84139 RepID=UPI003F949F73